MPSIIKDNRLVDNPWQILGKTDTPETCDVPAGKQLVPLNVWLTHKAQLAQRAGDIGVWVDSDQDVAELADDVGSLPVIAINFPAFTDGRGFSLGRLLRERYGFEGELRAVGNPICDQIFYLGRCGFDAFDLADHYDPQQCLNDYITLSDSYQAAVDQPLPRFRR